MKTVVQAVVVAGALTLLLVPMTLLFMLCLYMSDGSGVEVWWAEVACWQSFAMACGAFVGFLPVSGMADKHTTALTTALRSPPGR